MDTHAHLHLSHPANPLHALRIGRCECHADKDATVHCRSGRRHSVTTWGPGFVSKIIASKAIALDIIDRDYLDNAAAVAAGLSKGDLYHNAGDLKVVVN